MYRHLIDFETNVFNLCLEYDISIPEDIRGVLLNQYTNSTHSIEITGNGFYDNIIISKDCEKIPYDTLRFGCMHIEFENPDDALGMVVFVSDGYISLIEFYTYGERQEPWIGNITAYDVYAVNRQGELSWIKKIEA